METRARPSSVAKLPNLERAKKERQELQAKSQELTECCPLTAVCCLYDRAGTRPASPREVASRWPPYSHSRGRPRLHRGGRFLPHVSSPPAGTGAHLRRSLGRFRRAPAHLAACFR